MWPQIKLELFGKKGELLTGTPPCQSASQGGAVFSGMVTEITDTD
jgi:hypothetical protein